MWIFRPPDYATREKPCTILSHLVIAFAKDTEELQRFIGILNCYREYLPHMTEIAAPLYNPP